MKDLVDLEADLRVRTAWLYYMEGMTQDAVAQVLGITRVRVLRILAQCRRDGTVQIRVNLGTSSNVTVERQLEEQFGLQRAIVIPRPQVEGDANALIGAATGAYIQDVLTDGMTVGLGWGETLTASLINIPRRRLENLTVVSLLGGLTKVSAVNPSEFAWRFADRLEASCFIMAAPVYAPDSLTRDALMRHPGIKELNDRARRLDLAIVSVGDLSPLSTINRYELLDRRDLVSVEQAGAVGDVLCRFMNAAGEVLDHPVNSRIIAVDPRDLKTARSIILASGGWKKTEAIRAALRLVRPTVLITDFDVAERLVSVPDPALFAKTASSVDA